MAYFPTNVLDNQIKALPTVKAISNQAVATFDTDMTDRLVSCVADIPSGKSEVNICACGINLYDMTVGRRLNYSLFPTGTTLYINIDYSGGYTVYFGFTDETNTPVNLTGGTLYTYVCPKDVNVIAFPQTQYDYCVANNKIMQVSVETFSEFTAFNGSIYNVPFGETLSDTATYDAISGLLTRNDTTTKQLNSCNIVSLDNELNHIYNNCGDTSLSYQITIGASL